MDIRRSNSKDRRELSNFVQTNKEVVARNNAQGSITREDVLANVLALEALWSLSLHV